MKFFNPLLRDDTETDRTNETLEKQESIISPSKKKPETSSVTGTKKNALRHYALVFGYLGTGFHGMQKQGGSGNPDLPTVEGVLERALIACHAIDIKDGKLERKVRWSRAARTDKGVHAVAQLIAAKMRLPEVDSKPVVTSQEMYPLTETTLLAPSSTEHLQQKKLVNLLQDQLDKTGYHDRIRIFSLYRVTKSFDARLQCFSRAYLYVLPFSSLSPAQLTEHGKRHPGSQFFLSTEHSLSSNLIPNFEQNGNQCPFNPQEPKRKASPINFNLFRTDIKLHKLNEVAYNPVYVTFETYDNVKNDELEKKAKDISNRLLELFSQYKGSHNYHNFTPGGRSDDPSMKRFIHAINVKVEWLDDSEPMLIIAVKGQSFLLNQIRKMIGLVVQIVRGTAPEDAISRCFSLSHKYSIYMAPAAGLVLDSVIRKLYH